MDLGRPIGHTVPTDGFDQGEHGAGTGLSGGHGHVGTHNTQAGMAHAAQSGSSGSGVPSGTPIADKFTSSGQGQNSVAGAYAGGAADDGLTGQSNAHRTGAGVGPLAENLPTSSASAASGAHHGHSHSHHHGTSGVESTGSAPGAVSGAYESGPIRGDALTGESHAHRTGAGVGPLGENLAAGSTAGSHSHEHSHGARDAALASTAGGALAGAGAAGAAHHHHSHNENQARSSDIGTGVGPSGGAGGHYSTGTGSTGTNQLTDNYGLGSSGHTGNTGSTAGAGAGLAGIGAGAGAAAAGAGYGGLGQGAGNDSGVATGGLGSGTGASGAGVLDAQRAGAQAHRQGQTGVLSSGSGTGAGAGAAGLGAGAAATGAGVAGAGGVNSSAPSANNERGQPIMDPKELDHGGRHGLILDPATGKYVHRHEVEETGKKI